MEKITELTSTNVVQHNIEKLKELFPTAVSEGKLIVEELQALMGEYIEKDKEYYQMTWAGKTEAQKEANKVSTGTLRPAKEESKDWDTTGNLVIEGDNLEVLKLLQKTYSNKVKMIYIDPPYNTGNDFVYKDNYKDNLSNYLELTGQTDEEGKKLNSNTDSDGRYHSNWLNMMYPRLKLARNLLTDDGVIFISIDDNEQANLKKVCDEIFGEENNIGDFIVTRSEGGGLAKHVIKGHDYLLAYSKNLNQFKPLLRPKDIRGQIVEKDGEDYWIEEDWFRKEFGKYGTCPYEEILEYYSEEKKAEIDKGLKEGEYCLLKKNGFHIVGRYRKISEDGSKFYSILKHLNKNGIIDLRALGLDIIFDFPKPISLLKQIVLGATFLTKNNSEIILDFFSGSATTAHAVMALNAKDGGNRKCISVQLPEPTDEKSEAYKAGYTTIAEITKERIRRAGELIKKEHKDKDGIENLDVGFRVFKLDSSNIKAWDTSVENFEEQLDMFAQNNGENIKPDRTEEDILFEILLKYGLELTVPIIEKQIAGNKVYNIGFGSMYICFEDKVNPEVAKGIGMWHKQEFTDNNPSVIFKDNGFATDADKTNTVQTLKQFGISNVKSI